LPEFVFGYHALPRSSDLSLALSAVNSSLYS
jgi:hypothetical protein